MPELHAGQMLRIFVDVTDRWHGQPLHVAIVEMLHNKQVRGVSVFQGIAGYGAHHQLHVARFFRVNDMPVVIDVVDDETTIEALLPALSLMVTEGMVTLERVDFGAFRKTTPSLARTEVH